MHIIYVCTGSIENCVLHRENSAQKNRKWHGDEGPWVWDLHGGVVKSE